MSKADYYDLLEVSHQAQTAEIKAAYRKKAFEYHPDRNPGSHEAEEKFKLVSEAYEVLSDDTKRRIYDQYGHEGLSHQPGFHGFTSTDDVFSAFSDIFEDFFGFGTGRHGTSRRARHGRDLGTELTIEFLEACFGIEKETVIQRSVRCEDCQGSGVKRGSQPIKCSYCNGYGQIQARQGFFTISTTCPQCRGQGRIIKDKCPTCHGHGVKRQEKKLKVKVPAGVMDGIRLMLQGEGEAGENQGPSGDLYVVVHVQPHPEFQRQDDNIISELGVTFPEAALGLNCVVNTIEGEKTVTVKPGTQSGETIRLKGMGVANVRNARRGDHIIVVRVRTPQTLTPRQKELLEELALEFAPAGRKKNLKRSGGESK